MLGLANSLAMLMAAQVLMGIAQAGVFPAACNSIAKWMPLSRRSLSCAILATGMQVGAILASLITGMWLEAVGWRWLFLLYALPGFLWSLWFAWRFRDEPQQDRQVNAAEIGVIRADGDQAAPAAPAAGPTPWWALWQHASFWFLCGQQICRASGYMFFASWFPTFLQKTRDVSVSESGSLQALVFTGTLVGSLCGGMVTDAIWRISGSLRLSRSGVGSLALGSCGMLILAAWFVDSVGMAVLLMTLGSVCAAIAGPCAFAAAIDIGGRHVPQVFGVMNMAGNLAAAACPILIAWLFDWTANWNLVLLLFAIIYLLGAVSWLMVDSGQRLLSTESRSAESDLQ
jgi:ACS family glucarate transporter-like MFS transporter/ACS family D-galactonate transporter-like MFS transporter